VLIFTYQHPFLSIFDFTTFPPCQSIENINLLIDIQKRSYASGIAYDYLCNELENILQCLFEVKDTLDEMGDTQSVEKDVLRNLVFSAAHMIYINACLKQFHDSNIPKETN